MENINRALRKSEGTEIYFKVYCEGGLGSNIYNVA